MSDNIKQSKVTIRGIDPELYKLARIEALKKGKAVGRWLNELIKEELSKIKKEE